VGRVSPKFPDFRCFPGSSCVPAPFFRVISRISGVPRPYFRPGRPNSRVWGMFSLLSFRLALLGRIPTVFLRCSRLSSFISPIFRFANDSSLFAFLPVLGCSVAELCRCRLLRSMGCVRVGRVSFRSGVGILRRCLGCTTVPWVFRCQSPKALAIRIYAHLFTFSVHGCLAVGRSWSYSVPLRRSPPEVPKALVPWVFRCQSPKALAMWFRVPPSTSYCSSQLSICQPQRVSSVCQ